MCKLSWESPHELHFAHMVLILPPQLTSTTFQENSWGYRREYLQLSGEKAFAVIPVYAIHYTSGPHKNVMFVAQPQSEASSYKT